MAIGDPDSAGKASALLRHWLAETHTSVEPGTLDLVIGSLRFRTEVTRHSPTGAHGFGPIYVLGADHEPIAVAEPSVLAAACAKDAQARGAADTDLDDVVPASPLEHSWPIGDSSQAHQWLRSHVDNDLRPALPSTPHQNLEDLTASLLTRQAVAAIGQLGLRGVADEPELLATLSKFLRAVAEDQPDTGWLLWHWLTSPTLTDVAVLNRPGSRNRYEVPNPLRPLNVPDPQVPGVPLPELGPEWSLRPVEVADGEGGPDVRLVHQWMHLDHVAAKWKQDWPLAQWRGELAKQLGGQHSLPCLVSHRGRQIAYVELYRVARDKLAECYPYHPRDLGVHIAIGEPAAVGRGVGSSLLRAVAAGLLAADPECQRVVAEPDVHNGASIGAFAKAGFVRQREVGLPSKNAALMIFSR